MKKALFVVPVAVFATALVAHYSLADTASAKPFTDIWNAIATLGQRIDTLVLTPGPKGDKGDQGEPGPAGPRGEIGPAGTQGSQGPAGQDGEDGMNGNTLRIEDGNGQDLGVLIVADKQLREFITVVDGMVFQFSQNEYSRTARYDSTQSVFYTEPNCQGAPYAGNAGNPGVAFMSGTGQFFQYVNGVETKSMKVLSQLDPNQACRGQSMWMDAWPIEEVSAPFILPLAWPLRVVVE